MVLTVNHVDEEDKFIAKYVDTYGVKTPCISKNGGSLIFDELLDPFFSGVPFLIHPDHSFWSGYSSAENYHTGLGTYQNAIGGTLSSMGIKPHVHSNDDPEFQFTVTNGTGTGNYKEGESFSITAKDSTGYEFTAWVGDTVLLSSTSSATTTVTMGNSNASVTATYTKENPTSINGYSPDAVGGVFLSVAGQKLSISVPHQEQVAMKIFSANGRLVFSSKMELFASGTNHIALPEQLTNGVFVVSITGETISLNKRLLIQ